MNKSVEKKSAIIFSLLVTGIIFFSWCAGALLLSRNYASKKINSIKNMYEQLDIAASEYGVESEEFKTIFETNTSTFNCDILVLDQYMNVLEANVIDENVETERLLNYFFDKGAKSNTPPKVFEKTDKYTVQISNNYTLESEYIELWGVLSEGYPIFIRSAMSGINNSAKVANTFFAYIGIIAVLISYFLCKIVAKIISKNSELELELKKRNEIDEMRKEFLSNVSHELKTPIALIQGYAEGLQDCVNDDKESRDFYCDVIVDETKKMNKLVRNLLDLNELEFGADNNTIEDFDIAELINNCITTYDMVMKQNGVKLEYEPLEPVYVSSDELKVEQVFNNYFTNALNHVDFDKIIRVRIEKEKDKKVRVSVFNTGKQIPSESLPRIWDKFYKVDKAHTREYGGSGVGLSIVKASMDALNQKYGVINCTDGVEFWFEVDSK